MSMSVKVNRIAARSFMIWRVAAFSSFRCLLEYQAHNLPLSGVLSDELKARESFRLPLGETEKLYSLRCEKITLRSRPRNGSQLVSPAPSNATVDVDDRLNESEV